MCNSSAKCIFSVRFDKIDALGKLRAQKKVSSKKSATLTSSCRNNDIVFYDGLAQKDDPAYFVFVCLNKLELSIDYNEERKT